MAVTRTSKGSAQSKTSGLTLTIASVALNAGDLLVVSMAYDDVALTSVAWGAQGMTLGDAVLGAGVRTRLAWGVAAATGTQTIMATWDSAVTAKAMVADSYRCSTPGLELQTEHNGTNSGNGAAASVAAIGPIHGGTDSVTHGMVGTEGPNGDTAGTWVNPTSLGTRLGTTGQGATSNVTASSGYQLAPSAGSSPALSKTGMTSRDWGAAIRHFYWATAAEQHSGTATVTGGGTAVAVGAKTGQVAPTLTGGGTATATGQKDAALNAVLSGGGAAVLASQKAASASPTLTGGGSASAAQSTGREAFVVLTGGGAASASGMQTESRSGSVTATGGGAVVVAPRKDSLTTPTLTGGGAVVVAPRKDALAAPSVSGGGVAALFGEKGAQAAVSLTGAGAVTYAYEVLQQEGRSGSVVVTGGGSLATTQSTARNYAVGVSGSGAATVVAASGREDGVSVSGGGILTLESTTARSVTLSFSASGPLVVEGSSSRGGFVEITGGGRVNVTAGDATEEHQGTVEVTGAGSVALVLAAGHTGSVAGTGSGSADAVGAAGRLVSLSLSGAGALDVTGESGRASSVSLAGGGALDVQTIGGREASVSLTGAGAVEVAGSPARQGMDAYGNVARIPPLEIAEWFWTTRGQTTDVALLTLKAAEALQGGDVRHARRLADASELLAAHWAFVQEGEVNDQIQEAHAPAFRLQSR